MTRQRQSATQLRKRDRFIVGKLGNRDTLRGQKQPFCREIAKNGEKRTAFITEPIFDGVAVRKKSTPRRYRMRSSPFCYSLRLAAKPGLPRSIPSSDKPMSLLRSGSVRTAVTMTSASTARGDVELAPLYDNSGRLGGWRGCVSRRHRCHHRVR